MNNNHDFSVAMTSLRTQANQFGLDVNDSKFNSFLVHVAEVMAQDRASEREAFRLAHDEMLGLRGD